METQTWAVGSGMWAVDRSPCFCIQAPTGLVIVLHKCSVFVCEMHGILSPQGNQKQARTVSLPDFSELRAMCFWSEQAEVEPAGEASCNGSGWLKLTKYGINISNDMNNSRYNIT